MHSREDTCVSISALCFSTILFQLHFFPACPAAATAPFEWSAEGAVCGVALAQGFRASQEDAATCQLLVVPPDVPLQASSERQCGGALPAVHLAAAFDGHAGAEASQLAVRRLPELLLEHMRALLRTDGARQVAVQQQVPPGTPGKVPPGVGLGARPAQQELRRRLSQDQCSNGEAPPGQGGSVGGGGGGSQRGPCGQSQALSQSQGESQSQRDSQFEDQGEGGGRLRNQEDRDLPGEQAALPLLPLDEADLADALRRALADVDNEFLEV
eukprot:jgi/Mesen1/9292/ME000060S08728